MTLARIPPGKIVDTAAKLGARLSLGVRAVGNRELPGYTPHVSTARVMTASLVRAVKAAGYLGVVRYVPRVGAAGSKDITASEIATILGAGLGVLLVQHVRMPPWNPAEYSGHDDGMAAASRALGAGYPKGAHIFCDLEGISGSAASTSTYANDWADAVVAAGFRAGAYVGYAVPLSARELYLLHNVTSYWSDPGPREVATRGFAIKQQKQITIAGVYFDPDIVSTDRKGETPYWMAP